MKRLLKTDRSIPLGVRRPDSDELLRGPFSSGRRSERYGAITGEKREQSEKLYLQIMTKNRMKKEN